MRNVALAVIIISFLLSGYLYSQMPDQIATHWNIQGQVDGYTLKPWGIFLIPLLSFTIFFLFSLIAKIDPLKENIKKFKKSFDGAMFLIVLFFFYLQLLIILWNTGLEFNMNQLIAPAFGGLFYFLGDLIGRTKRNWFIGIKTPWTLSSDIVWDKTHKAGAGLFKIAGIISLLAVLLPSYGIVFIIAPIIIFSVYLIIFSYLEYKKLKIDNS